MACLEGGNACIEADLRVGPGPRRRGIYYGQESNHGFPRRGIWALSGPFACFTVARSVRLFQPYVTLYMIRLQGNRVPVELVAQSRVPNRRDETRTDVSLVA